jgi:3-oxoacyl-[acyl-carrier-protein] synthase II
VVVTGLGAVTSIGHNVPDFWQALVAGRSGIGRVTHFDVSGFRSHLAGEVRDFRPEQWCDKKAADRMDRFTQFAVAAAAMALPDAGLAAGGFDPVRAGVIVGSGIGGSRTIEDGYRLLQERGPGALSPFFVSKLLVNMAACLVSIEHGLKGPLSAPSESS